MENFENNFITCNWCGNPTRLIWVHGHGQCEVCRTNIEECCKGDICQPELSPEENSNNNSSQKNLNENL